MFLAKTHDELLEQLGSPKLVHHDEVIPGEVPHLDHNPYTVEYGWLFTYERRLARRLDEWLIAYRHDLIGCKGILSEALSNAYCHGNRRDEHALIVVEVFVGAHGVAVRITDQGDGFPVEEVLAKVTSGKKGYYTIGGNGMRRMMESEAFGVVFELSKGACTLVHFFEGGLSKYSIDVKRSP